MVEVVNTIQNLLDHGCFDSEIDSWINGIRKELDSFYNRTKNQKGELAAEAELKEFEEERHLYKLSTSIKTIVLGMKSFDQLSGNQDCLEISPCSRESEPYYSYMMGPEAQKITFSNPQQPGCGCNQVPGSEVWGIHGKMGLQKVIICFDNNPVRAHLFLIFSSRNYPNVKNAYCAIMIGNEGFLNGSEVAAKMTTKGGDIDSRIGFPGATDYLAKHIESLGPYISALAKELSHKH